MKQWKHRHKIPAEVCAKEHGRRYICLGEGLRTGLDPVHIVRIGPLQIVPVDPPGGNAVMFVFYIRYPLSKGLEHLV